ncbi:MAG: 2-oxoacid:acceptor oxidoreductase family protein [Deltaproteobacteria bacterium]|nr:2-oxoacid:acceptor oxidoreductase family protein [Deltaproteobacteria bacterium]
MGVLRSSLILAELAFRNGLDVKKSEVHGMAQRGGSVCSDVRFGVAVGSPMIPSGEVNYLILMEEADLPLYQMDLSADATVFTASQIPLTRLATKRALNIAMLGLLSSELDFSQDAWRDVIHDYLPPKIHAANDDAFALGRAIAQGEKQ